MSDIFAAHHFDDARGEEWLIYTKHGAFWYYSGCWATEAEALAEAERLREREQGVIVQRRVTEIVHRWEEP